jgi:hypothetical protein
MKKRAKKIKEQKEHRGNNEKLVKQYEDKMNVVRRVPKTYYTREGELRHVGSRTEKNNNL